MCQEHTFVEIVGEAGVITGAAPARLERSWGSDSGERLGLAKLLDEKTLVAALLWDKKHTQIYIWAITEMMME